MNKLKQITTYNILTGLLDQNMVLIVSNLTKITRKYKLLFIATVIEFKMNQVMKSLSYKKKVMLNFID